MKFEKDKFNNKERGKAEILSEKEKQRVHEIKKLPASVIDKINLLLVWRGLKPCTKLTYVYKEWGAGDPEPDLTTNRKHSHVLEFNQLLGFIGLSAVAGREDRKEPSFETSIDKKDISVPGKEYRDYFIAPNLETAEKLANGSIEEIKTEIDEVVKAEIQKLCPELYSEMIKARL